MINISFPDGNSKEYENGSTLYDIATSISPSLAKKCIAGIVNDQERDLHDPINEDAKIILITTDDLDHGFHILNHSTAHVMAQAILRLFPNAKITIGPSIDEGFYYDIDADNEIKESDLPRIEKEMQKIAANALDFSHKEVSYDEALEIFKDNPYKIYLINKIKDNGEKITIYQQGDFTDLCRGIHVDNTKRIQHFKLLNIAGAYWLGDSDNKMLQRIYGTSWFTKEQLDKHLQILEDRKNRDHRKLGKELELFAFTQETGAGLPLWLPNGATIRYELEKFIKEEELRRGYKHVYTPVLGTKQLYETSGHWDHYKDDMFAPIEMGNETFVLRPMCCPHHAMIFKNTRKSYRDLPYRVAELGGMHRYEASGALTGLERVRNMCLNDAHLFVRPDQIREEFTKVLDLVKYAVETLKLDINYYRLSLRDPNNKEKYFDDDEMWNMAENELRAALDEIGIDYIEALDEAAFYGPKLDIQIKTALGHDVTLATVQLDFLLPQKFDLTYTDKDQSEKRPVIIHRGIISTMERMTATLIEQYKGAFPTWLSPTQLNVIPVSSPNYDDYQPQIDYCNNIFYELNQENVRITIDDREEKLNKKIREAQVAKIPYTLVIGNDEVNNNTVTIRKYGEENTTTMPYNEFKSLLLNEIKTRS